MLVVAWDSLLHPFPRHCTTPPLPIAQLTLKPAHAGVTAQLQARGAVPHGLGMHFELAGFGPI